MHSNAVLCYASLAIAITCIAVKIDCNKSSDKLSTNADKQCFSPTKLVNQVLHSLCHRCRRSHRIFDKPFLRKSFIYYHFTTKCRRMSSIDSNALLFGQTVMSLMFGIWFVFALCLSWTLFHVFRTNSKYIKQKIFSFIVSKTDSLNLSTCLESYKRELFSSLNDMISSDSSLAERGSGCLRILEIGIGSANNLRFYPTKTRLITVEPNCNFDGLLQKKLQDFPHIVLEKSINGCAEDMSAIEDESIDVVVSTHVLCSVSDIKQCLKEIRRVLQPNGRFLYVEHVSYESGSLEQKIQTWVEYVWKLFNDDCRLTLQTSRFIKEANFSSIDEQSVVVKELLIALIRPHIFGIAYK